jgi:hypothetical protein
MDLVAELITDTRFRDFIKTCLKENKEESDMNIEISELQAREILSKKGRSPGARQMARYRADGYCNNEDCLPYIDGKPMSYKKGDVYAWRDRNFIIKRKS